MEAGLLSELEAMLYGTDTANSFLLIVDNGDGTWVAVGPSQVITMLTSSTFEISEVDAVYLDANTYALSSTAIGVLEPDPLLIITDNGDGTWTAEGNYEVIKVNRPAQLSKSRLLM